MLTIVILIVLGTFAGTIDAIAGGGGLITLPALTLFLGPGAHAIGSNKIVGVTGAFVALLVYFRGGHLDWRKSLVFSGWVGVGSAIGSHLTPLLPAIAFKIFLVVTCPLILWIVWRRDIWVRQAKTPTRGTRKGWKKILEPAIVATGIACGIYDGMWGPGGGTFMFLGLLFVAELPLLQAVAAAKVSNSISAGTALVSYANGGYVHWEYGIPLALGMAIGAFIGARYASRNSAKVVRPVLAIVVALLVGRLLFQ